MSDVCSFKDLALDLNAVVEPAVGRDRLVAVGQLLRSGEFFEALFTLVKYAENYHVAVPVRLRDDILAALASVGPRLSEDAAAMKAALAELAAA